MCGKTVLQYMAIVESLGHAYRLWPEMQARMAPSCPLKVWTLTALLRLQTADRAKPVALKSTPSSQVIFQPQSAPAQSARSAQLEANPHAATSGQAASVPPHQAHMDSTPLASAAAPSPPLGQAVQTPEAKQHSLASGVAAHMPIPQQSPQCDEAVLQANASSQQHQQMQAGSSRGKQGDNLERAYNSSRLKEQHAMQTMSADAVECSSDQVPSQRQSVLQHAPRQPQPTTLQGGTGLGSGRLPGQQHSAAPSTPASLGDGGTGMTRLHGCSAQHGASQASTVACTGPTQYYTLPRNLTQVAASPLPGTQSMAEGPQSLAERPQDAEHASMHGRDTQALLQSSAPSPAAVQSPNAAGDEMAGPSNCPVSKDFFMPMLAEH